MADKNPSRIHYDKLHKFTDMERLILDGESEDIFRECKAPTSPSVNSGIKNKLAIGVSGFSNTEGGILIYGIETQKHQRSGSDVMTSITRVGNIDNFARAMANTIPTLTIPAVTNFDYKVIKKRPSDTAGVLIFYIPRQSHPVQSQLDRKFYFRGGDQFVDAPYSVIERLFLASEAPSVEVSLGNFSVSELNGSPQHKFDLILTNKSFTVARDVAIFMEILEPDAINTFDGGNLHDSSDVNSGRKTYAYSVEGVLHYEYGTVIARPTVTMKPNKRKVVLKVVVYADRMVPETYIIECSFLKRIGVVKRITRI